MRSASTCMKVVILLAGIGSRLGNSLPKCLTPLRPDYAILDHQLENLEAFAGDILAVVGFKKEIILERHPELLFAYNPRFDQSPHVANRVDRFPGVEAWLPQEVVGSQAAAFG